MWILIVLSITVLIIFLWQISNLISVIFGSLYVKTNRDIIKKALELAKVKKGDIFYDLGCGNGDVLIEAAKLGAKAIGFEISPYYYVFTKIKVCLWKIFNINRSSVKSHIEIRFNDIKKVDLSRADVVYVYLLPEFLEKLAPKFTKELKSSARLVLIGFPIKNSMFLARVKKVEKYRVKNHNIFIYK